MFSISRCATVKFNRKSNKFYFGSAFLALPIASQMPSSLERRNRTGCQCRIHSWWYIVTLYNCPNYVRKKVTLNGKQFTHRNLLQLNNFSFRFHLTSSTSLSSRHRFFSRRCFILAPLLWKSIAATARHWNPIPLSCYRRVFSVSAAHPERNARSPSFQ